MRRLSLHSSSFSLALLYDEFRLPKAIRRSLNLILLANLFGNLHGIICGGGTTAMVISYFVGQHYYPIKYPLKDIAIYFGIAAQRQR